ncbi:MAG: S41 family peptidase [Chloroflexi bacterium]|nr:S41 family peptidase [Chloroflexota bacterium]
MRIFQRVLLLVVVLVVALAPLGATSAAFAPDPATHDPAFSTQLSPPEATAAAPTTERQLEAVGQGFDLLMDRFVQPLSSDFLLSAAWRASVAELDGIEGAQTSVPTPLLIGARAQDWLLFRAQWLELQTANAGRVDPTRLARAALRGMAQVVNEGHTVYLDPQRYAEHLAWSRGEVRYGGIGARIAGPEPTVIEVFDDSPAAQAGLEPGDVITHVDRQAVVGRSLVETINQVRGEQGTTVELTVRRAGQSEPLVLRIVRARIELSMVRSRMLPGQVGYLQVRGFPDQSVVSRVQEALADLRAQGARALVLDLRGNSGGRLDVGTRLLSMFVSSGPLYQQITREGSTETASVLPGVEHVDLPLSVLIDGGTASMGEIFASAVQEHGAGWIVGETTSGNVAAGQVFPLVDGSALQVTVMEIRSGQGEHLNSLGVRPDLRVERAPQAFTRGYDPQLEAALDLFAHPRFGPAEGEHRVDQPSRARAA